MTLPHILKVTATQYKDQVNWMLKWAATVITIAGALAISYSIDPLNIYLLNIACVLWIVWALRIREYSILTVNAVMLVIYGHGLFNRLF
jgi:hypothetical protein